MTDDIAPGADRENAFPPADTLSGDIPLPTAPSGQVNQDAPASETPPEPEEETDEEWARRFVEENAHLAPPPLVRPPAPPPQPWDGPRSQWKVPDHLSMPHPNGGYMAMALLSRTMDDLDEVTGGKRAATYEEVDKYFGHALIAEGLVPFTYTADEAIRWWKAGGYRVLANEVVPHDSAEQALGANQRAGGLAAPIEAGNSLPEPVHTPKRSATMSNAVWSTSLPSGLESSNARLRSSQLATQTRSALELDAAGESDPVFIQANYRGSRLGRGPFGSGAPGRRAFIESLPPIQYLRANAYDHATRQIALLNPQASYTIQSPTFVPTFEQLRQRNEQLINVRRAVVDNITRHAFESHILGSRPAGARPYKRAVREMPEIRTIAQFKSLIYEAISRPTYVKPLPNGRTAFWYDRSSLLVIVNTRYPQKSSAYQPERGVSYFHALN